MTLPYERTHAVLYVEDFLTEPHKPKTNPRCA